MNYYQVEAHYQQIAEMEKTMKKLFSPKGKPVNVVQKLKFLEDTSEQHRLKVSIYYLINKRNSLSWK